MFATGDIVKIYSPQASYPKYYLCISTLDKTEAAKFLFINSEEGYEEDFVLANDDIPCLPENETGLSVISCSMLPRFNAKQLKLFKAEKLGVLETPLIEALLQFLRMNRALSREEKRHCVGCLEHHLAQRKDPS
jgi:hypothetical protein